MKLYYYSNMAGAASWAVNVADFRKSHNLPSDSFAVRCCHKGIAAPTGYEKLSGELANGAATKIGQRKVVLNGKTNGRQVNFYELGLSILGSSMTGFNE